MEIGDYVFDFVNNIQIVSTWENITDTCEITVPKKLRVKKEGLFTDAITAGNESMWRRNDPVKIYLGYDDNNDLRFDGVLTRISPKLPLVFNCEDKMFLLKQTTVSKYSKASVTLPQMLTDILPIDPETGVQYAFEAEDISLGKFMIERCSVVEVFDYLKKPPFGLSSYFKDGILYVGFAYRISSIADIATGIPEEFEFQRNIIDDSNLDYIRDDDVKLRVKVVNRNAQNQITETEYGDSFGELRTIQVYSLSAADADIIGNEALQKYKYEGFRGSFTAFLQPMVKHGDAIRLVDPLIPDRTGVYLVRQVVTTFGMDGGRQEITLDRKI
jgi:hypothetical protein